MIIFSAFSRLRHFPEVFGQVKKLLILQLHEMMRMLRIVACPIVFILFYGRDWQGGVFKLMKNDHLLNIFISFGLFPQVFSLTNK